MSVGSAFRPPGSECWPAAPGQGGGSDCPDIRRAPRVQIEYDVEVYGAQKKVQLPFVMGVMASLIVSSARQREIVFYNTLDVRPLESLEGRRNMEIWR